MVALAIFFAVFGLAVVLGMGSSWVIAKLFGLV